MPGVAAVVNGLQIRMGDLAEECIARHGAETLEVLINRSLLEQACRKQGLAVTRQDIDDEIVHAASLGVKPKRDGTPDVDAWLSLVTRRQGIPLDIYRQDVVWPTAALKKLVAGKIAVTEEDLRKGFEANYGPRVRCLAIVLNNQRQAQEVFEMARQQQHGRRTSATWPSSIRSSPAARSCAAKCRRSRSTAASRNWSRRPSRCGRASCRASSRSATSSSSSVARNIPRRNASSSPRSAANCTTTCWRRSAPRDARRVREAAGRGHHRQLPGQHQPLAEIRRRGLARR